MIRDKHARTGDSSYSGKKNSYKIKYWDRNTSFPCDACCPYCLPRTDPGQGIEGAGPGPESCNLATSASMPRNAHSHSMLHSHHIDATHMVENLLQHTVKSSFQGQDTTSTNGIHGYAQESGMAFGGSCVGRSDDSCVHKGDRRRCQEAPRIG